MGDLRDRVSTMNLVYWYFNGKTQPQGEGEKEKKMKEIEEIRTEIESSADKSGAKRRGGEVKTNGNED